MREKITGMAIPPSAGAIGSAIANSVSSFFPSPTEELKAAFDHKQRHYSFFQIDSFTRIQIKNSEGKIFSY